MQYWLGMPISWFSKGVRSSSSTSLTCYQHQGQPRYSHSHLDSHLLAYLYSCGSDTRVPVAVEQANIFSPSLMAKTVGLPPDDPVVLAQLAVLVGCDYTRYKKGRIELLKHFGLADTLSDIAAFLAQRTDEDQAALMKFLAAEEHKDFREAALYSMELYSLSRPYPEDLSDAFMDRLVQQGESREHYHGSWFLCR